MRLKVQNICCIGAGYVGGPTMAIIAERCPNIQVEVVDLNEERIRNWNQDDFDKLPIYEPGLAKIVEKCRGKNLHFSNLIKEKIEQADMVFISVNTPTKQKGLGAGKASNLKWVEACARQVAKYSKNHTIVVEKSTLPVRTAEVIKSILNEEKCAPNKTNIDKVFIKGRFMKFMFEKLSDSKKGRVLSNKSQIIDLIRNDLNNNDSLMVKASNATGFNKIIKEIKGVN